jgi:hypothetical protein
MPPLHLSKVAVSCASLETLKRRQSLRVSDGEVPLITRFMPKRAEELVGGSIYWIIKHQLVARQSIIGFATREADRRTIIRLSPDLVPVRPAPKRAHQGWRYLVADDAPGDLDSDETCLAQLPPALAAKLSLLKLI